MNRKIIYTTQCEAGVCPVCSGSLNFSGTDKLKEVHLWTCPTCGASGEEGYIYIGSGNGDDFDPREDTEFNGLHSNVRLKNGTPVEIRLSATMKTLSKEARPVTIEAECLEDVCPICGCETEQTGNDCCRKYGIDFEWKCKNCGASGWSFYEEETEYTFTGKYNDVRLKDGTPVIITPPTETAETQAWKIPVSWEMCGYVYIDAPTLREAMELAVSGDIPLPDGNYVDDSFALSYDCEEEIRELHNGGKSDTEPKTDRFWAEIRNSHWETESEMPHDCGDALACVSIDAWATADDNEEGTVIACVMLSKHGDVLVDYRHPVARVDAPAQEAIREAKEQLKEYYNQHSKNH